VPRLSPCASASASKPASLPWTDIGPTVPSSTSLLRLADREGEDAVLDWLGWGLPTPGLDVAALADVLAAGVTAQRYGWLVRR